MIVVADSGPLHYLILLQHIELLQRFYGQVLVPEPVASELSAAGAPAVVRGWITKPPTWVDVRPVPSDAVSMITDDLDPGERAAIALAETVHADLLLIDEAAGRAEAKRACCDGWSPRIADQPTLRTKARKIVSRCPQDGRTAAWPASSSRRRYQHRSRSAIAGARPWLVER
jgi:predicted nucleic acid-binding protein